MFNDQFVACHSHLGNVFAIFLLNKDSNQTSFFQWKKDFLVQLSGPVLNVTSSGELPYQGTSTKQLYQVRKQRKPPADYPLSYPVCAPRSVSIVDREDVVRASGRVPKWWLWLDGCVWLFMSAAHPVDPIRTSGHGSKPFTSMDALPPPPPPSDFHHCVAFLPGPSSTWVMKEGACFWADCNLWPNLAWMERFLKLLYLSFYVSTGRQPVGSV